MEKILSTKDDIRLNKSFSNIIEKVGKMLTGLQLSLQFFEPFQQIGIMSAFLKQEGITPLSMHSLNVENLRKFQHFLLQFLLECHFLEFPQIKAGGTGVGDGAGGLHFEIHFAGPADESKLLISLRIPSLLTFLKTNE